MLCQKTTKGARILNSPIAANSAYDMFSWYKYLVVGLFFSCLGFWSGNLFLIAPFPDRCLLVPFCEDNEGVVHVTPSITYSL